jgi:hypothetical protein
MNSSTRCFSSTHDRERRDIKKGTGENHRTRNSLKYILFKYPNLAEKLMQITRLKKKKIPKDFPDYDHLREWFSDSTHFSRLTDFLLENFKEDQVIYLIDLVSETFPEFHERLVKNEPKRGH